MDASKVASFDFIAAGDFLQHHDFGSTVRQFKGAEGPEILDRCREFFDQLVDSNPAQHCVSADCMCGVYCFCPGLLMEGDDVHVFNLFRKLVRVLGVVVRSLMASQVLQ